MRDRILMVVLLVSGLVVGAWALAAPMSFYESFPGLGMTWVSADGPFNEHLVRDVGALNLALAIVTAVAALRPERLLVMAAAAAWLVYGLPHLAYHAVHAGVLPATDAVAEIAALLLPIGAAVWALLPPRGRATNADKTNH